MPTKIEYQTGRGISGRGYEIELIGYCKESPVKVLQAVYQTHAIHSFKHLPRPVDFAFPNNCSGLDIFEGEAPAGTSITGLLKDLDLSRGIVKLAAPRTEQTYRVALKNIIEQCFVNHIINTNYLDTRNQRKDRTLERYIPPILEVAHVTLGIEKPTVRDLKKILRGE